MALDRRSHAAYADLFGPISADDAHAEPEADRLFVESAGAYPKISISTQIEIDGLLLNVTINDTSIADAVALLRRRRAQAKPTARQARHTPPQAASWFDLDTEPSEQGARVVQLATALMDTQPGWSAALAVASKTIKENLK
ncbi:MAG TPA: hypothetical protein VFU22_24990 [Roseiflexaceae bacterium]|nr:hypothetical protein [Roseiflexaceae bacterium]